MKARLPLLLICLLVASCGKQSAPAPGGGGGAGGPIAMRPAEPPVISAAAFSQDPDCKYLVTGYNKGENKCLRLWEVPSGKELLSWHSSGVGFIAFLPDSYKLITLSGNGKAQLWDIPSGKEIWTAPDDPGRDYDTATLTADGTQLAVIGPRGLKVWEMATGNLIHQLNKDQGLPGKLIRPTISISPDKSLAISGTNSGWGPLYLWKIQDGTEVHSIALNEDKGYCGGAFLPNGKRAVLNHFEGLGIRKPTSTMHLFDLESKQVIRTIDMEPFHCGPWFSKNGKQIYGQALTESGGIALVVVEVETGKKLKTIPLTIRKDLSIGVLCFSLDGKYAFTGYAGSEPVSIEFLWDMEKGDLLKRLRAAESMP